MSTEQDGGSSSQPAASQIQNPTETTTPSSQQSPSEPSSQPTTPPKLGDEPHIGGHFDLESSLKKPAAKRGQPSESSFPTTTGDTLLRQRPVIAVSASKGPAAFFNLARKFLVTDEVCDLSALEGAIVSAVDAAHLLERSKLATIIRVHTSYVTVEPKRRKQIPSPHQQQPRQSPYHSLPDQSPRNSPAALAPAALAATQPAAQPGGQPQSHTSSPGQTASSGLTSSSLSASRIRSGGTPGRELRRARIVISVKRTDSYKQWLEENPLQAIVAGDAGDDDEEPEESSATAEVQQRPR